MAKPLTVITAEKILSSLDRDSLQILSKTLCCFYKLNCTLTLGYDYNTWQIQPKNVGIIGVYPTKEECMNAFVAFMEERRKEWNGTLDIKGNTYYMLQNGKPKARYDFSIVPLIGKWF